ESKHVGFEADVVAREQATVAIERGVLDRLGGDGRAELLELRNGAMLNARCLRIAGALGEPSRKLLRNGAIGREASRLRACKGCLKERPVVDRSLSRRCVGPVDRKVRQDLDQRAAQRSMRQLGASQIGEPVEAR